MNRLTISVIAAGCAVLDVLMVILSFGFYGQWKDGYALSRIGFCLSVSSFDVRYSLLEFFVLAVIRSSIILGGLFGVLRNTNQGVDRAKTWHLAVIFLAIFGWAYSPAKILEFAEIDGNLKIVAMWLCVGWNGVASFGVSVVWRCVLCRMPITTVLSVDGGVEDHRVSTTTTADEGAPLVDNEQHAPANGTNGTLTVSSGEQASPTDKIKTATDEKTKKEDEDKVKLDRETFSHALRLLRYCKSEWKWYFAGFIFLFIYSGARVFLPYFTGQVIASVVASQSAEQLRQYVFIMTGLSLISALFGGGRGGCFTYANAKVVRTMRSQLFRSLVHQELGFFDATKTGEVTSRLTADCQTISDTVSLNVNVFLRNIVMLVGGLIFMFKLSWRLSLITFIAVPVVGLISKLYGAYYDRLSEETQSTLAKANEVADEVLGSMRTVRSFACEREEADRYHGFLTQVLDIARRKAIVYVGYVWTNEICDTSILVAVLWYGGHLVLSGRMTSDNLISFLLYQLQLGENFYNIGYVWTGLMQSVGASRKVFEYIDRQPAIKNEGELQTVKLDGKIEFDNVCFSYPTRPNTQVLNNMKFTVNPGEIVALVGPSGGGKSSCVSLLDLFYQPSSGCIKLDGVSITDYDHKFLHTKIALVGQEPVLFARSVSDNIAYGVDGGVKQDEIEKVAKMANAHSFIQEAADGYGTNVGEKGVQLSGGQKQRIAIARALVRRPAVLLLDEATSALDSESEHLVQEAIYSNLSGHTVLLIAHRLSTVEKADRIVVVNKGTVEQQGTHKELLQVDGLYRNLVQRQLLGNTFDAYQPPSSTSSSKPTSGFQSPIDDESTQSQSEQLSEHLSERGFRSPLSSSLDSNEGTPHV